MMTSSLARCAGVMASIFCLLHPWVAAAAPDLVVRGDIIHTMAGSAIEDGVVLIEDGKITRVGSASRVRVPDDVRTLRAAVVVPGLIDAHATVGLTGIYNVPHDQDHLDTTEPIQPELRVLDAYNIRERLVQWVREIGVTTVHTGHAPKALVPGQTMVVKTAGANVDSAVLVPFATVAATLGPSAMAGAGKSPGTRGKAVALLRAKLIEAQSYREKMAGDADEQPARDLALEALAAVLAKDVPLLITAQRHHDISSALRLADEFDIDIILDGAAEAHLVVDQIRAAGVPVFIHPTMARTAWPAGGELENAGLETAALLHDAGIPIAFQSGYEAYVPKVRVVLFEAAMAAAHGLGFEAALDAVTLGAAKLLGVDDRVGSLERGKDADLALYDGDPFEYTTHCVATVIDGQVVFEGAR